MTSPLHIPPPPPRPPALSSTPLSSPTFRTSGSQKGQTDSLDSLTSLIFQVPTVTFLPSKQKDFGTIFSNRNGPRHRASNLRVLLQTGPQMMCPLQKEGSASTLSTSCVD